MRQKGNKLNNILNNALNMILFSRQQGYYKFTRFIKNYSQVNISCLRKRSFEKSSCRIKNKDKNVIFSNAHGLIFIRTLNGHFQLHPKKKMTPYNIFLLIAKSGKSTCTKPKIELNLPSVDEAKHIVSSKPSSDIIKKTPSSENAVLIDGMIADVEISSGEF